METLRYGIGIDIAKDKFDCCISTITHMQVVEVKAQASFANSPSGFDAFTQWVSKHRKLAHLPLAFLMEATGVYYEQLAWYLHTKDCPVSVVLPNKAKKYKESLGLKSKNDRIDARGLAQMICERAYTSWQPLSKSLYTLRLIARQIESITTQATATANSLHALTYGMFRDKQAEQIYAQQLVLLEQQKQALRLRVEQIVAADPALQRKFVAILKIKGLGIQSLAVIVAETNGFAAFESAAQLVSYAGYDVIENQSGNREGKTSISKRGNSHIRRAMYFPAFNMVRYDVGTFPGLYERIFERTRIKMKGYVAVQKKLLTLVYALWKKDEAFDPGYHQSLKEQASRDTELVPSLATAGKPVKKVTPAITTRVTQDKHPSKPRRMPSLADTNLPT